MAVDDSSSQRVVYVAGLAHSGSTLLDRLLGASPGAVAVGEAYQTMRDPPIGRLCSCGAAQVDCPLWGPALASVRPGDSRSMLYERFLEAAEQAFPPGTVLVDESKRLDVLQMLLATGARVDVVLLVRDVRSWTVSQRQTARTRGRLDLVPMVRKGDLRKLAQRRQLTSWSRFSRWHRLILELESWLVPSGVLRATVGYEILATRPEAELRRLCDALDLGYDAAMLVPANGVGHILRGNLEPAKLPTELRSVSLSTAWLSSDEWLLPSLVRRKVMATNRRLVYGKR